MERHVFYAVGSADPGGFAPEGRFLPDAYERDRTIAFLMQRFPPHCPHHLLHNLLNGHYSRHPLCDARPFHDDQCRHGSHSRPQLSAAEISSTAPAAGVVIFLPFGLSYGTSPFENENRLVSGCADCEPLQDGDTCGGCRRVWHPESGCAVPARGFAGTTGEYASLHAWRESVWLTGSCLPVDGEVDEEECWGEEDWDEEDWGEEDWGEEEEDGEDGEGEEEWADEAEGVAVQGDWDGDGEEEYSDQGAPSWGAGRWARDGRGGWSWIVDFPAAPLAPAEAASAPAPAVPPEPAVAATAPAPAEAAGTVLRVLELELEVARLKQAALPAPAVAAGAPAPAVAAGAVLRILELELEVARLKQAALPV